MDTPISTGEKKFLEDIATYSKIPKEVWQEVFKTIAATMVIKFVSGVVEIEIPYIGKITKSEFEMSKVVKDLVNSNEDERLELVEEVLIKNIKASLLEKVKS